MVGNFRISSVILSIFLFIQGCTGHVTILYRVDRFGSKAKIAEFYQDSDQLCEATGKFLNASEKKDYFYGGWYCE
jgi:hypothetical protein